MRNEYVYRSSLDLIKSINSDERYDNLEEDLRILLRNNIQNQNEKRTRKTSLKADWILKKQEDTYIVLLATNEPGSMDAESFKNLSRELPNKDDLANHYNLFAGDYLLCSFYKNIGGEYSLTWSNSTMVRWNNEDILPEVFLMDSKGNSYRVDNLITHLPSTSQPNYWGKRSEDEYILEKSTKTAWEEALLTFPECFSSEKEQTEIIINGVELQAIEVEDSETLIYNETGETKEFKTNAQSFDFQIITDILPEEIIKSNLHVVKNTISRIYVFKKGGDENEVDDDDDEKTFEARKIEYSKDKTNWKTLKRKEFLPYGLLYLRIHFGNMMEEAVVFNIGNLEIQNQDATTVSATISFHSRADFSIEPKPNELWDIEEINNGEFKISLTNRLKSPRTLRFALKSREDNRALFIEIAPPFEGIQVIDNENNIVKQGSELNISDLHGCRLVNRKNGKVSVRMSNTCNGEIKIIRECAKGNIPIIDYLNDFRRLFSISDLMDDNCKILFEICENQRDNLRRKASFNIGRYNNRVEQSCENDETLLRFERDSDADLIAIPLDCSASQIDTISLEKSDGIFRFPDNLPSDKFLIVESNENAQSTLLPIFVTSDPDNVPTDEHDRLERISSYADELSKSEIDSEAWYKFNIYFTTCDYYKLPFAAFDILRSVAINPKVAARAFFFLNEKLRAYQNAEEFHNQLRKLEEDTGFLFHWVPQKEWISAAGWASMEISAVVPFLKESTKIEINNMCYDISTQQPNMQHLMPTPAILQGLRQRLGNQVLNEIPNTYWDLEEVDTLIHKADDHRIIRLLLEAPIAAALSIKDKNRKIWENSIDGFKIRRNYLYAREMDKNWYNQILLYSINKLQ